MFYHTSHKLYVRSVLEDLDRRKSGKKINWNTDAKTVEYYTQVYPQIKRNKYIQYYLTELIPTNTLKNDVINLMSFEDMKAYESESSPFANSSKPLSVIPLASWTGMCDGDTWALDVIRGEICSVSLEANVDNYDDLQRFIYLRFYSVNEWLKYLIGRIHIGGYGDVTLLA